MSIFLEALSRFGMVEGAEETPWGLRVYVRFFEPQVHSMEALTDWLYARGFWPVIQPAGEGLWAVTLQKAPPKKPLNRWIPLVLLGATLVTTFLAGMFHSGGDPGTALAFGVSLMAILGTHELGHFLTARRWKVDTTPPYFIPFPNPLLGTLGAFIRIRSPLPHLKALLDVAAAGPWAGFVVALVVSWLGLNLSVFVPVDSAQVGIRLGDSLIFKLMAFLVKGPTPPGQDLLLHPVAFAGWIGFFVTALNLLPIGQLDGGHVIYALFPRHHRTFALLTLMALLGLGFFWQGWWMWMLLTLFLGLGHPPPLNPYLPLDRRRRRWAWATIGLFVITFVPVPFSTS